MEVRGCGGAAEKTVRRDEVGTICSSGSGIFAGGLFLRGGVKTCSESKERARVLENCQRGRREGLNDEGASGPGSLVATQINVKAARRRGKGGKRGVFGLELERTLKHDD
jgi:hypothetical protein